MHRNDSVYPLYGTSATPLIGEHSTLDVVFRWLRWMATLCALVLAIDVMCVVLIWEDGVQTLERIAMVEKAALGLDAGTAAGRFVDATMASAHEAVFAMTGLGDWLSMQRSGLLSAILNSVWVVVETAVLGLQLFALRIAVLVLSLPLFIAAAAAAVADGVYAWLIRRTGGARESGFIYHRAKRATPAILLLLWAVYLVPPVPMDPRWVLPPFAVLFAMAIRLRIAYFKKHI